MIEHEYVSVVCEAAAASLRCDRAGAVLLALRHAVERNPLDEALLAHLLLVLAADGKQAEAMALYQEMRLRLADELGVDPGTELRAAYDRILRQETAALPPGEPADDYGAPEWPGVTGPHEHPLVKPVQLPSDLPCFVGRADVLARATALTRPTGGPPCGSWRSTAFPASARRRWPFIWRTACPANSPTGSSTSTCAASSSTAVPRTRTRCCAAS